MVREITVNWNTNAGGGFVSVFHFIEATSVSTQRSALATMLGSMDAYLQSSVSWSVAQEGRERDTATGALTGAWSDAPLLLGTGAISTGAPVPDAAQVLIRWGTGNIVDGRFLQGRTFIPGLTNGQTSGGNVNGTVLTAWQTAINTYLAAAVQPAVWHRPKNGAGGALWAIESGTVWPEFAVLRRRRA